MEYPYSQILIIIIGISLCIGFFCNIILIAPASNPNIKSAFIVFWKQNTAIQVTIAVILVEGMIWIAIGIIGFIYADKIQDVWIIKGYPHHLCLFMYDVTLVCVFAGSFYSIIYYMIISSNAMQNINEGKITNLQSAMLIIVVVVSFIVNVVPDAVMVYTNLRIYSSIATYSDSILCFGSICLGLRYALPMYKFLQDGEKLMIRTPSRASSIVSSKRPISNPTTPRSSLIVNSPQISNPSTPRLSSLNSNIRPVSTSPCTSNNMLKFDSVLDVNKTRINIDSNFESVLHESNDLQNTQVSSRLFPSSSVISRESQSFKILLNDVEIAIKNGFSNEQSQHLSPIQPKSPIVSKLSTVSTRNKLEMNMQTEIQDLSLCPSCCKMVAESWAKYFLLSSNKYIFKGIVLSMLFFLPACYTFVYATLYIVVWPNLTYDPGVLRDIFYPSYIIVWISHFIFIISSREYIKWHKV